MRSYSVCVCRLSVCVYTDVQYCSSPVSGRACPVWQGVVLREKLDFVQERTPGLCPWLAGAGWLTTLNSRRDTVAGQQASWWYDTILLL